MSPVRTERPIPSIVIVFVIPSGSCDEVVAVVVVVVAGGVENSIVCLLLLC